MQDVINDVRISIRGLECGMYVSRLDRPWIETDFPLHGLLVEDEADLRKLQQLCSYLYVDTSRGASPDPRFFVFDEDEQQAAERVRKEFTDLRKTTWQVTTEFNAELRKAETAYDDIEGGVAEMMSDLSSGRKIDLNRLNHGVKAMVDSIIRNPSAFAWLKEIRRRDEYTYQHALGCAVWGASFGRQLGLEQAELELLALGGLLCDVGKTRLSMDLLAKTSPLSSEEAATVRQHVEHSLEIVSGTPGMPIKVIEMVATHHERNDGSGYPNGLVGSEIPIFGRIMGVVDSYDAMTCVRPYAASRPPHEAVAELYAKRGSLFQPELVEQFIQTCGIYPTGSLVELSNGEVGVITAVNSLKRLRPTVMLLLDAEKSPLAQFRSIDLEKVMLDADGRSLGVKRGLQSGAYGINPKELFLD